ncbi:MAG TPA: acetyl-CoA carboxylase biotin carboxyl carrier protein [Pyrinomonadaceae bacterium]|nr:acetyl-CoA carboxylase biotin carboxyl carrier protein [Pyrinomonadaceae bacterium]
MARKEGDLNPNRRSKARAESSERPGASVNMDELRELIALLRENGLAEFELERADFRVRLRRESSQPSSNYIADAAAIVPSPPPAEAPATPKAASPTAHHPGAQAETAASEDSDLHLISSPIVGTFYRSPSPTADPFVKIGSNVEAETVVCIIEAMKLMNEIQAEAAGEVVKIYVENGQPVEYGQPLFGIRS